MKVTVNGTDHEVESGATVASLLDAIGVGAATSGVAVAVDGAVVPRSAWADEALAPGAVIEIVTATQGG